MAISGKPGFEVDDPPVGSEEEEVASMAISGEPSPEALGEKAQGTMGSGSPIGDDVSGRSSPAAKADEIYSSMEKNY
jgi:hypothetical protein